jgi:hypothetical protein
VRYWILRELDATLIVTVSNYGLQHLIGQLCYQLVKPDVFTTSKAGCHVVFLRYASATVDYFLLN